MVGNTKDRLANWKVGGPNYTPIRLGAPQFITPQHYDSLSDTLKGDEVDDLPVYCSPIKFDLCDQSSTRTNPRRLAILLMILSAPQLVHRRMTRVLNTVGVLAGTLERDRIQLPFRAAYRASHLGLKDDLVMVYIPESN